MDAPIESFWRLKFVEIWPFLCPQSVTDLGQLALAVGNDSDRSRDLVPEPGSQLWFPVTIHMDKWRGIYRDRTGITPLLYLSLIHI